MPNHISAVKLKKRALNLGPEHSVEWTAMRLEHMNWTPELLEDIADFPRISRLQLIEAIDGLLSMNDDDIRERFPALEMSPERIRITGASLLVNAGELLWRLRDDVPEAWDFVNELYEDD